MSVELTRLPGVKVGTIPYYSTSGWAPPIGPLSNPVDLYVPMWQSGRLVWSPIGGSNGPLTGLLTVTGDMIYRDGTGAVVRLPIGNLTDILTVQNSGGNSIPSWQAATSAVITDFNEAAQDAVGAMVANSSTVTLTYVDGTPSLTAAHISGSIPIADLATSSTAHTPTVTQGGTVTSFTVNATRYQTEGGWITLSGYVSVNNAGTAAGANNVTFSLPINAVDQAGHIVGSGAIFDASAGLYYRAHVAIASATTVFFYPVANANNAVLGSDTFVAALATGDIISFTARYRK